MKKVIIGVVLAVFLLGAGYVIWEFASKKPVIQSKAMDAIPKDAAIIVRSSDMLDFWFDKVYTHKSWSVNQLIPSFQNIDKKIRLIDSLSKDFPEFNHISSDHEVYFSTVMTGPNNYDMLIACEFTEEEKQYFDVFQEKYFTNKKLIKRLYNEETISDFVRDNGERVSFAIVNNLFLLSETPTLLERSILDLKSNGGISKNAMVKKLFSTSNLKADANIFVNFQNLGELNRTFLKNHKIFLSDNPTVGNWCELDLNVKDHGVYLTGLTATKDSLSDFFYSFRHQKPVTSEFDKILPANTAVFVHSNVTDNASFIKDYSSVLDKHQLLFNYENRLTNTKEKFGEESIGRLVNTLSGDWCSFVTEPINEKFENQICLTYKLTDVENDQRALTNVLEMIDSDSTFTETYQNYQIKEFNNSQIFNFIFNQKMGLDNQSYFTYIEDYVVFANDLGNLKHVINSYLKGLTLSKSSEYVEFLTKFPKEHSFYAYINLNHGNTILENSLRDNYAKKYQAFQDSSTSWNRMAFMLKGGEDLMYTNVYMSYSPVRKETSMSLYSKKLKAPIVTEPTVVLNHYTKEKEIIVQDEENNLYLLTADGKQLWSLDLGEKIISKIHQVDRYKNNKIQYLFNTQSSIYLLDRNGENVENFPVRLKTKASNGLSVFDYDKNRKYRIFLAHANKEIKCYDIRGKIVQGWNVMKTKSEIATEIQWIRKSDKDYLTFVEQSGQIKVLNRRGKDRIRVEEKLPANKNYFFNDNENVEMCSYLCTDSVGTIHQVNFANVKTVTPVKAYTENHRFYLNDIDADDYNDYIYLDEEEIDVFKLSKTKLFEFSDGDIGHISSLSLQKAKNAYLALVDESDEKTYLINGMGAIVQGFPVVGSTPMLVEDLDLDGKPEMIIGDREGNIYFYSFSEGEVVQ